MENSTEKILLDVNELIDATIGTSHEFKIEIDPNYEDFELKSPLKSKVSVMRIEKGLNAKIEEGSTEAILQCDRCLEPFTKKVTLEKTERQFYLKEPQKIDDPNDLYLIDMKNRQIDLTELFRQEIILHFPLIPLCSTGCKGICAKCGINKNENTCDCTEDDSGEYKPLAALKDLIK